MERKHVTNTARLLLEIWNTGAFAAVWVLYYNRFAFDTYQVTGGAVTILLFAAVYNMLCGVYKAFRIASSSIGETLFSQVIAFGAADLILYIQCCLIWNRYVNIVPGAAAFLWQSFGTAFLVFASKWYFRKHVPAKDTLVIYGDGIEEAEAEAFCSRILKKYAHLFRIQKIESERKPWEEITADIDHCDTVLLYELSNGKRTDILTHCMETRKTFYFTPRIFDILLQGCSPKHLLDTPLLKYDYVYEKQGGHVSKRILDLVLSLAALILLSPVFLFTAAAVKLEDHGPVLYRQKRCTKDGRVFEILKFRSMVTDAEKNGAKPCEMNDSRITRVGKVIRASRIDELPQLINILKGDMSFVGPRPERVEHVEAYTREVPEFAYRMRVKGGLTGYAQIFGKYNTSAYDKLRLDLMYIENQSFLLDLKLIMLTFRTIFQPESTEGFTVEKSRKMNEKAGRQVVRTYQVQERGRALDQAVK